MNLRSNWKKMIYNHEGFESEILNVNGIRTHVYQNKTLNTPTLLIIHGTQSNAHFAAENFLQYKERYRIVGIDIPGEPGYSQAQRLSKKNDALAMWIHAIINQLQLEKITLIGYSFGGFVALKSAINFNQNIENLFLINPAGIVNGNLFSSLRKLILPSVLFKILKKEKYALEAYHALYDHFDTVNFEFFKENLLHHSPDTSSTPLFKAKELKSLLLPIHIFSSEKDFIFSSQKLQQKSKEQFASQLKFHKIKNAKHVASIEKLDQLLRELL